LSENWDKRDAKDLEEQGGAEMRKSKEERGVSRRMFCKLVSTGAAAIGCSYLIPSSSLKIGDGGLLGVRLAEAVTTVNMNEVPKESNASKLFTGPDVTRQSLISDSKELRVGIVNFGKGVRNKFHTHDVDQVLIVTAGRGIVATEKGEKTVTVGEVILFPAGEKHWHGATKDSEFSHIVVTRVGGKTTQIED
jgi:quercetin dioxygenase-like cupin family protein